MLVFVEFARQAALTLARRKILSSAQVSTLLKSIVGGDL
jgi:hypothetical protein